MAILNGIPFEDPACRISAAEAYKLGVDVDPRDDTGADYWNLIDSELDGKSAITVWRVVRYVPSLHAYDDHMSLVEMKPKTGRYHQLRRHAAWVLQKPIVGDAEYDNGTEVTMKFRGNGLFLCATSIVLEHFTYNHVDTVVDCFPYSFPSTAKLENDEPRGRDASDTGSYSIYRDLETGKVMIRASVGLPNKFENLLSRASDRYEKFAVLDTCDDRIH
jgi:RNA pseudouridylate synthase